MTMSSFPHTSQPPIIGTDFSGVSQHYTHTYPSFAETSASGAAGYADYASSDPSSGKAKKASAAKDKEGPVKAACLSCRGKKAKCDGAKPKCSTCIKRGYDCEYVKSRRGGARKKREVPVPSALQQFLTRLDGILGIPEYKVAKPVREPTDDVTNIVREFTSREEIFRCYYNDVHPYVPIMPQQEYMHKVLPTLLEESPFILAAQTILVLVPHPNDPDPSSANSKRLRNATSNALAQQCTDVINRILERGQRSLECVQALTMLSLWEWSANGSVKANRERAAQAVQIAMDMGLHDMDKYETAPQNRAALEGIDWQKDMARRTWWQIFVNQLSSAAVSGNAPLITPDDDRVHVFYPICTVDDQSWPRWIEANKLVTRVFGIVNTVYYSHLTPTEVDAGANANAWGATATAVTDDTKEKMRLKIFDVDLKITELLREAEAMSVIDLVPGGEEEVVRNQQLSARLGLALCHIHIHRQQAFPEVSLFSKRICGLPNNEGPVTPNSTSQVSPVQTGIQSNPSPAFSEPAVDGPFDFIDELWQPNRFPDSLNDPWFALDGGAGSLYKSYKEDPVFTELTAAEITSYHSPTGSSERSGQGRSARSDSGGQKKPRKAWGVDEHDKVEEPPVPANTELFPPGLSLERCAAAAHTVVRLEVLHRSAAIALWKGPPKWMPFCACGLVTGAYAFLLLALATQAESMYRPANPKAIEQVEGLLTNVEIIVAGLEAYGQMWAGIEVMAAEVRAALEAAKSLPGEIRKQIDEANVQAGLASAAAFASGLQAPAAVHPQGFTPLVDMNGQVSGQGQAYIEAGSGQSYGGVNQTPPGQAYLQSPPLYTPPQGYPIQTPPYGSVNPTPPGTSAGLQDQHWFGDTPPLSTSSSGNVPQLHQAQQQQQQRQQQNYLPQSSWQ